ncbi:hypothetical protein HMPREF0497_2734 [Lentilactobacillus buchneri ATCC 11577]|uniref:Uncharacterized protein n=1 Tax=Lentilactobacillus hilgardii (strain ATCC 8290 / DSM 20176 / CCUG 30140 / JCM 1155 / KCTC 3500 / NBRC 15886 / NCIMB 8040 / NRRL B-1843 / 9) TaxID=1423757 RepID=C0XMK5_LENH9|nr:hypothetical protein HMPREF0497_2734 [Lentilactobacillus buchneri ATCC 11577]EEI23376.1 hypothetical protein HMPREF0519_2466 [Lentilactobacillus hilgardii DSM 20176 = ATCC 8290]
MFLLIHTTLNKKCLTSVVEKKIVFPISDHQGRKISSKTIKQ